MQLYNKAKKKCSYMKYSKIQLYSGNKQYKIQQNRSDLFQLYTEKK